MHRFERRFIETSRRSCVRYGRTTERHEVPRQARAWLVAFLKSNWSNCDSRECAAVFARGSAQLRFGGVSKGARGPAARGGGSESVLLGRPRLLRLQPQVEARDWTGLDSWRGPGRPHGRLFGLLASPGRDAAMRGPPWHIGPCLQNGALWRGRRGRQ